MFDDFERCVQGFVDGVASLAWVGPKLAIQAPDGAGQYFITLLLRDGSALESALPPDWGGRITRNVVASYLSATVFIYQRPPDWGVHGPIVGINAGEATVMSSFDVSMPLIDPIRDGAKTDDKTVLPIAVKFEAPWDALLTPWEHLDGYFGRADPNPSWMRRRRRIARAKTGRGWWEVRGLRDADDSDRYSGHWPDPAEFVAYLGWPAYFLDAAGDPHPCEHCTAPTISGRRYCSRSECKRTRAAERQRLSRSAKKTNRLATEA